MSFSQETENLREEAPVGFVQTDKPLMLPFHGFCQTDKPRFIRHVLLYISTTYLTKSGS